MTVVTGDDPVDFDRPAALDGAAPVTPRQVAAAIAGGLPVLISVFLAVVLAGFAVLRSIPPQYTAIMAVGPIAHTGAAAMGPRVPGTAGETAGTLTEPGGSAETLSDFRRFLALLGSVPVAERLAADPVLMRSLFADHWDEARAVWQAPRGLSADLRRLVLLALGRADWVVPDAVVLARHLRRTLMVEAVDGGPIYRLSFRHPDRATALAVVRGAVAAADAHLRAEAARRSAAEISHIRRRLEQVAVTEHRRALIDLLAEQE